jgi:hypothetical protein
MSERPYLALLRALHGAGVRHAICGGLAVVLHGVPRMTFDLDLVVDLAPENVSRLVDVLAREGYRPRLPVPLTDLKDETKRDDWVANRNLIAFSLHHPTRQMEEIDILIAPGVTWAEVQESLVRRPINGESVAVIGRALLRRMKLSTGREKDKADAELLGE